MSFKKKNKTLNPDSLAHTLDRLLAPVAGRNFLLAYSGGIDSTVLLHLLATLRQRQAFHLRAVHFDHGLSPASSAWAAHCAQVCAALDVPLQQYSLNLTTAGKGLEAAARAARYAALETELAPGEVVLTAHHRDDQAETLLLRLVRGAGTRGLAGLPPLRPFAAGSLARPLLTYTRTDILGYARAQGLRWIEDESNADTGLDRNYFRHEILPALRSRWPGVDGVLARTADLLAGERLVLDERAREDWQTCAEGDELSVHACAKLSEPRLRNLLVHWLAANPPASQHVHELVQQIRTPSSTSRAIVRWPGTEVRRYRDRLQLVQPQKYPVDFDCSWDPVDDLVIPGLGVVLRSTRVEGTGLAVARLTQPVRVRARVGGERCRLPGQAHSRPLKKLLQESGIPPWERTQLPLVFVGEELAAIGDRWVCAPFLAGPREVGLVLRLDVIPE